jgi:hypothetical protein
MKINNSLYDNLTGRLTGLFEAMRDRSEEQFVMPQNLKDAVFSTLDTTSVFADIIDLFTVKFIQAQTELLDAIPNSPYVKEEDNLFDYFQKNFNNQ